VKRSAPAKRRSKPRRGPLRDKKYRDWLGGRACVVFSMSPNYQGCRFLWLKSEAAHTQNNGMGSKGPDSSCVSLCCGHHKEYDAGRKAFEKKYRLDMKAIAVKQYAEYLKHAMSEKRSNNDGGDHQKCED
jgi:hypothetical protein